MNAALKKSLTKFAKQDIKLAKKQGSVIVVDCKVFGRLSNVTIYKTENDMFNITWLDHDTKLNMGYWDALTEQMVIDFMLDAYQVTEVA